MRALWLVLAIAPGMASAQKPAAAKEMEHALAVLNQSLGLESYPEPHCLKREYGHMTFTPAEVRACAEKALKEGFPGLGKSYAIAVLMASVGPSTLIAIALDAPGWAVLSCDPGKPCPPRKSGTDKMGKRVAERLERACKNDTTVWLPKKLGCP
jgi:hypothetical protein